MQCLLFNFLDFDDVVGSSTFSMEERHENLEGFENAKYNETRKLHVYAGGELQRWGVIRPYVLPPEEDHCRNASWSSWNASVEICKDG